MVGVLVLVYPERAQEEVKKSFRSALEKYGEKDTSLTKLIDTIQHDVSFKNINMKYVFNYLKLGK